MAVSHLGFMFILTVGTMIFLGLKIDEWAGTSPWGVLVGLTLGFGFGFYYLVATVFRQSDESDPVQGGDDGDDGGNRGQDEDTNGRGEAP